MLVHHQATVALHSEKRRATLSSASVTRQGPDDVVKMTARAKLRLGEYRTFWMRAHTSDLRQFDLGLVAEFDQHGHNRGVRLNMPSIMLSGEHSLNYGINVFLFEDDGRYGAEATFYGVVQNDPVAAIDELGLFLDWDRLDHFQAMIRKAPHKGEWSDPFGDFTFRHKPGRRGQLAMGELVSPIFPGVEGLAFNVTPDLRFRAAFEPQQTYF